MYKKLTVSKTFSVKGKVISHNLTPGFLSLLSSIKNYNEIQNWNSLNSLCEVKTNVSSVLKYSAIFLTQTFLRLVQMKHLNYLKLCLNFVCTL